MASTKNLGGGDGLFVFGWFRRSEDCGEIFFHARRGWALDDTAYLNACTFDDDGWNVNEFEELNGVTGFVKLSAYCDELDVEAAVCGEFKRLQQPRHVLLAIR